MNLSELKKNYGIGITGGIASGKTTVGNFIKKYGYELFDADLLSREAVKKGSTGLEKIIKVFGSGIIDTDGNLDRKKLGEIVFSDKSLKQELENIIHPQLEELLYQKIENTSLIKIPKIWFYDAALLFETNRHKEFKEVWTTYCPVKIQLERIKKRNPDKFEFFKKIIHQQMPMEEKLKLSDRTIDTHVSLEALENTVKKLLFEADTSCQKLV